MPVAISNVVVGVDFSDSSSLALQYGAELAVRHGATLRVVHVREDAPLAALAIADPMRDDELRRLLDVRIEDAIAPSHINRDILPLSVEIEREEPAEALLLVADRYPNSVIVVGHRGKGMLERMFIGSVAADVVKRARHPVLVIRRRRNALPKHVLAAVDMGDLTDQVLRSAFAWARRAKAQLHILHVVPFAPAVDSFMMGPSVVSRPNTLDAEDLEIAKQRLKEVVDEVLGPDHGAEFITRHGVTDIEILSAAEMVMADLTVVGCHGSRGFRAFFLGNTAVRILKDSASSVLVVRPESA